MSVLVSVIIPLYNTITYINDCLESIINQDYPDIEVIVVDDGSTDGSLEFVQDYSKEHANVKVFSQYHQNASIARNRGMENAKGDYYIFIDSDDVLLPGVVSMLVKSAQDNEADLVIGNMQEINISGQIIKNLDMFTDKTLLIQEENSEPIYVNLLGMVPAPTNKFYKASVAKENNIVFGNVRIGQDLNFFLKYLNCCQRIVTIPDYIYQWRDMPTGMSRKLNLNLLDITASFKDIKDFIYTRGEEQNYKKYFETVEFFHYYRQMEKQYTYLDKKTRKLIVNYFELFIKTLIPELDKCLNIEEYRHSIKACKLKLMFKPVYISNWYAKHKRRQG